MQSDQSWVLPDGIEETLPPSAWHIENLRRRLLDLFASWGYDLVMPPTVEFLEALLTGTGEYLDLQTFKVTDQISGRTLGVRADMTPQVARIDAHYLKNDGPTRLCYFGSVLRTKAEQAGASREPLQFGAELFGSKSVNADIEILALMVSSLQLGGVKNLHVDIGHIGIFSALANAANLDAFIKQKMFDALQRKSTPEITEVCELAGLNAESRSWFETLATLFGTGESIEESVQCLNCREADVVAAVKQLRDFISLVQQRMPDLAVHFDMSELRGYEYHTGLIFSVFVEGHGREIARGGRYDDVGKAFGRARPATGFSADMREIMRVTGLDQKATARAVLAPNLDDESLRTAVLKLRASGERVVTALPESTLGAIEVDSQITSSIDRQLVKQGGNWIIQPLQ